ncbi:MAG: alpha/beta hydrolase [Burkholderiales bacterium]|nr:alpha/beta hydrolase [Burkholderiales bacterium]
MRAPLRRPPAADAPATQFATLALAGRDVRLEYAWVGSARADAPLVVFLHEGLGSLAMWKDYPGALCAAAGVRGLVFSREGYGRSTPRPSGERWPVDFMHRQAHTVLPALFAHLGIRAWPWLIGHSDGGSIALLYAAAYPDRVAGVIAVAPHLFVEDVSVRSIDAARAAYEATDLRARLARYHADPDSAFWGWNDIWLDPAFRDWNIEAALPAIRCPVLAVQGEDDEYGTMAQVEGVARLVPQARLVKLPACGHSPHRDQPAALTAAVVAFLRQHGIGEVAGPR